MTPLEPEDLLWDLPGHDGPAGELSGDDRLRAYRAGTLDAAATAELEALLAANPAARRRLVELSRVTLDSPSPALRERVLERLAPARPRFASRWIAAAAFTAAVITAGAITGTWWLTRETASPLPEMEVELTGLVDERGERDESLAPLIVRAYPTTRVRISVAVGGDTAGLAVALYRVVAGELQRVAPVAGEPVTAQHGRFLLTAEASVLAGNERGAVSLWVVLAPEDELPERVTLPAGTRAVEALAAGGRRQVSERTLQVEEP